jgi:hypothetical protein
VGLVSGVIVAGMHRSGTSLTTRLLRAGGWHPGDELLARHDEEYLEDSTFVELHRSWLQDCTGDVVPTDGVGHPDWGVVEGRVVDTAPRSDSVRAERNAAVRRYVDDRAARSRRWMAKDPRASLFLDDWASVADVRFVLVYRSPWDMLDSAMRLGHLGFCAQPGLVRAAWLDYNERLLAFAERHRERVCVVAGEAVATAPASVWAELSGFVGMQNTDMGEVVNPDRFVLRNDARAIASVYRTVYPDHTALLSRLDEIADVPRPGPATVPRRMAQPGGRVATGVGLQVVIVCRGDGEHLAEAIASVDEIADGSVELTIVDAGSSDHETRRVFEALQRSGRQVVDARSASSGLDLACASSRTRAVLALDSDKRLVPGVARAVAELAAEGFDLVLGGHRCYGMSTLVRTAPVGGHDAVQPDRLFEASAVVSRRLIDEMGGWDVGPGRTPVPSIDAMSGVRIRGIEDVLVEELVRNETPR